MTLTAQARRAAFSQAHSNTKDSLKGWNLGLRRPLYKELFPGKLEEQLRLQEYYAQPEGEVFSSPFRTYDEKKREQNASK